MNTLKIAFVCTALSLGIVTNAFAVVTYPSTIAPEFSELKAGKGRFKTCLASYRLHKAANTLDGKQWIVKGGGFYSECVKALKAAQ